MAEIGPAVERVTARNATVCLDRESWGVVIDALIEHLASSAGDGDTPRASACAGLIRMLSGPLSDPAGLSAIKQHESRR